MTYPFQTEHALRRAVQHLRDGNVALTEKTLTPLMDAPGALYHEALHLMAQVRYRQDQKAEAATLLMRALSIKPHQISVLVDLGKVLSELGRVAEAITAYRNVLELRSDFALAQFELGILLHKTKQSKDAERIFRELLGREPGNVRARLALSAVLADTQQLDEAETVLRDGLSESTEPRQKAELHTNIAIILRLQSKSTQALKHFEKAQEIDPTLTALDVHRAELLQDLKRNEESLALYRELLARDPLNVPVHNDYNDLLYRLGRQDEYLKSFDRVPKTATLQLAKAGFLMHEKRAEEAHDVYLDILAEDPSDKQAATGAAMALAHMGRYEETVAAFEQLTTRFTDDASLFRVAARASISHGDPKRALSLCQKGLAIAPDNQGCLAAMGVALRLMEDHERDEVLNGYESLIRVFDLEPPEGFSDMSTFNEELFIHLDKIHPPTRKYVSKTNVLVEKSSIGQLLLSLRGGSQTVGCIFGASHDLVNRLQSRITETVNRYIAELKQDDAHPFLSRRRNGFAYAGSWSSRLQDRGFHVNHIHTVGWISSCYYAGVPDVVQDKTAKQGWIKFGEPDLDVTLANPIRRAIQPAPGRLVLFPSYMWHGTMPFHSPTARVTVAFDAIPT